MEYDEEGLRSLRCGDIVKDCDCDRDCDCVQYVMGLAWGGVTGSGEMR